MADTRLSSSISSLRQKLLDQIPSANPEQLKRIARSARNLGHTQDTDIEDAINTRANTLIVTADATESEAIAAAINQVDDSINPNITASGTTATAAGTNIVTSDSAPGNPEDGDLWFKTDEMNLYIYYDDGTSSQWVQSNAPTVSGGSGDISDLTDSTGLLGSGGATVYADMAALIAATGMSSGDLALVTANNNMYVYNGSGWYKIATVQNDSPSAITGVNGTYSLAKDGTPTVITAVSTDPEGFTLIWSYAVTSGSLGTTATVSQNENVFTITPSTDSANAGTFGLTFSVTDGVNGAVNAISTFTLTFSIDWSSGSLQHSHRAWGWDATSQGSDIALSEDGDKMIVGNPSSGNNNEGTWSIFTRSGTNWGSPTHIAHTDNYENGRLGTSVAMDATGSRVAISALYGSTSGNTSNKAGNVIIYTLSGTTATREAVIVADTNYLYALNYPTYGGCISMDKLGERIIVGHAGATAGNRTNRGQAHIYKRTGTTWAKEQTLESDYNYDYQGNGVAISGDGNTVFVTRGAGGGNSNERAQTAAPSVKIYTRSGTSWSLQTEIDSPAGIYQNNRFGGISTGGIGSISCTNDGNILVIGDGGASSNGSNNNKHGKAWVFTRTGTSWDSGVALTPSSSLGTRDGFGTRVTIDDNGTVIVVGKPQAENSQYLDGGEFHVFQKNESGSFVEVDKISNPDDLSSVSGTEGPQDGAKFGQGLAISGNAEYLGVGAPIHFYYVSGNPTGYHGDHYGKTYVYIP